MRARPATMMIAILMMGCTAAAGGGEADLSDACGASGLQDRLGTVIEDPESVRDLAAQVRVIPPGTMVTQDFRPTRLNFELDDAGRVTRVYCG